MKPLKVHSGTVAPLDRANIDTDLIIPKQFLKSVQRTGFGPNLFDQLRYLDEGQPGMDNSGRLLNPDFILNQKQYSTATILLTRENFGCGSSREHATWALLGFGFRVLLAPSFADIFYNNCFKNGILPIVLNDDVINDLFQKSQSNEGLQLKVNLETQVITLPDGTELVFSIEQFRKHCLLEGLDDIDMTLTKADLIKSYEERQMRLCPWLFEDLQNADAK